MLIFIFLLCRIICTKFQNISRTLHFCVGGCTRKFWSIYITCVHVQFVQTLNVKEQNNDIIEKITYLILHQNLLNCCCVFCMQFDFICVLLIILYDIFRAIFHPFLQIFNVTVIVKSMFSLICTYDANINDAMPYIKYLFLTKI